jgi:acyl dehydratase
MKTMAPGAIKELVGQVVGTSAWVEVTQERINQFAEATGDFQFIHIDAEKAKLTPFGGTIAHGFLTLSLIPLLTQESDCPRPEGVKMGVNYGGNKTRFLAPVRSGKRVRGVFKLLELDEKRPGQWQQTMESPSRSKASPSPR